MKIAVNTDNIKLFECLSSQTRVKAIELLGKSPMNVGDLAAALGVSSVIMSRHISFMEECGIIDTESMPGKRGLQKICKLKLDEITLLFHKEGAATEVHRISIPVGQYSSYNVQPTCGLASPENYIGVCDDPRYFSSPDKIHAALLWFQSGWIEYNIPSYVITSKPVKCIEISLEICSEFPNYNENWPSDIHFYLNGILLGVWQSPGDFGSKRGTYTPDWWNSGTQYGLLKNLRISNKGTMLDGIRLSDTSLDKINIESGKDLLFRIAVPADSRHPGGVNIFGKGFGNYDQNIEVRVEYE